MRFCSVLRIIRNSPCCCLLLSSLSSWTAAAAAAAAVASSGAGKASRRYGRPEEEKHSFDRLATLKKVGKIIFNCS